MESRRDESVIAGVRQPPEESFSLLSPIGAKVHGFRAAYKRPPYGPPSVAGASSFGVISLRPRRNPHFFLFPFPFLLFYQANPGKAAKLHPPNPEAVENSLFPSKQKRPEVAGPGIVLSHFRRKQVFFRLINCYLRVVEHFFNFPKMHYICYRSPHEFSAK